MVAVTSQMLLSIHIPKTAGVSFRQVLAQLFQEDFLQKYWHFTDARGQVVPAVPDNVRCIHGHFPPEALLPQFPQAKLITWVRDPVERVISSYYHRLRDPDWNNPISRQLHEQRLSLIQFAELDLMRNEIARFMGGKRPREFAFIGHTEQFDASLVRFREQFGFPAVPVPRENCNPARTTDRYDVDARTRRRIAALNELDFKIYEEICREGI